MIARMASRAGSFVERVFPERQIYHRAEGQVRYFTLSTRAQFLVATVSAIAIGWTSYATASVFLRGHLLSAQSAEAVRIKMRYERWLAEARAREASALALLQTRTTDFEEAAREFDRRHQTLKDLLEHAIGRDMTGRSFASQETGGDSLVMTAAVEDPTPRRSRLAAADRARTSDFAGDDRLAALMVEQSRLLDRSEEAAQARVENLRSVLRLTGLNPEDVVAEDDNATGGPFISLGSGSEFEDPFARRVERVASRVAESETLERAIDSTPTGVPVGTKYRLTSGFGPRIDPITGRPAFHGGLDFASTRLAPITAAAPGRVSYVGWRGGYGRVVEIDHGHGFRTRYGHLHRTYVNRGDEVSAGDRVGAMGSTGRSTGRHLHYEVWFRGKSYDPAQFLKAGNYVQQG